MRRERVLDAACVLGIAIQLLRYYATLPLLGYLLTRPVRYEVIRPSELAVLVGGAYARAGRDPAWAVLLLGVLGLAYADPLRWLAGHRYGDRVAQLLRGRQRLAYERVERFTARWGSWALVLGWYTPVPVWLIQLAAGASGLSFKKFLAADLGGTAGYVTVMFTLGYAIGQPAVDGVRSGSHDATVGILIALPVVAIAGLVRQRVRRRGSVRAGR